MPVGSGISFDAIMIPSRDDSDKPTEDLSDQLHKLVEGLRDEIQELRDEVTALRRKESPEGPEALLTREEAAERLRISTRTLDNMAEAGEIHPVRIRGRVLYHPETLGTYIRSQAEGGSRYE